MMTDLVESAAAPPQHSTLRRLAARATWALRAGLNLVRLIAVAYEPEPTELWFGDSHAMYANGAKPSAFPVLTPDGQIVWHLGARLMYSLAKKDFPPNTRKVAALIGRFGRRGRVIPVFSAGEIDTRCHLVPLAEQPDFDLSFVAQFVDRGIEMARLMRSPVAVFLSPIPQSAIAPEQPDYPIRGTIDQRVAMAERVRLALEEAADAASGPVRAIVVDAFDLLSDEHGRLHVDMTDDGHHTNARGAACIRERFAEAAITWQVR